MLNKAILMGRLTRDPELRYTQNNTPVCQFTLAIDRTYSGKNQNQQADFIDVVAWRQAGEFVSQWFTKGMLMVVVGRIQSRGYTDRDGNKRTKIEVVADEIQFGETKKSREMNSGAQRREDTRADVGAPMENRYIGNDFAEIAEDDGEVPF